MDLADGRSIRKKGIEVLILKKAGQKSKKLPLIIAAVIVLILAAVYVGGVVYFQKLFLPNTTVNHVEAGGRSWSDVEKELLAAVDVYELKITGRKELEDTITAQEIGMKMDFGTKVQDAQEAQKKWAWPVVWIKGENLELESALSYEEDKLEATIKKLNCMDKKQALAPKDAYISKYDKKTGFSIVPEEENNRLDSEVFQKMVTDALDSLSSEITLEMLEKQDAYLHPAVYQDDEGLKKELEQMNQMVKVKLTYQFGDNIETITSEMIADWLKTDKKHQVSVDAEKAREYINSLARKYDTFNTAGTRSFKTSYGMTIQVQGGDYGWWMNRGETTDALVKAIEAGNDTQLTPVYYQTAASYGDLDYGNTYVEINVTAQRLFLYKDGKCILETDVVTGAPFHTETPSGVYGITYKERAHTMTGEDYRVETSYWMPFAGNVGMHDATWRNKFGGTLYKTNGSHGCVNMPYYATRTIYQTVDKGTPVICYRLSGTERSATSGHSDQEIGTIGVEAIERIGTVSKENYSIVKKRIEWARQVYTDLSSAQRAYVTNYQTLLDAEKALKNLW